MIIRCSSINRVLKCSHSLRLPQEDSDNKFSCAGTAQHELAERSLKGEDVVLEPNTKQYVDYVKDGYNIEETFRYEFINYTLQGTPDAFKLTDNTMEIVDLKNGFQEVTPFSNQFKGYAILLSKYYSFDNVKITVIQNCIVVSMVFKLSDLTPLVEMISERINGLSWNEGKHCQFCPSRIHCLKKTEKTEKIDLKNGNKMLKFLQSESEIGKQLKETKKYLLENRPEWFYNKTRRLKKWIDESKAPKENNLITLTPAAALKKGFNINDNIIEELSIHKIIRKDL